MMLPIFVPIANLMYSIKQSVLLLGPTSAGKCSHEYPRIKACCLMLYIKNHPAGLERTEYLLLCAVVVCQALALSCTDCAWHFAPKARAVVGYYVKQGPAPGPLGSDPERPCRAAGPGQGWYFAAVGALIAVELASKVSPDSKQITQ